jgi:large subunit ribosomal protein L21
MYAVIETGGKQYRVEVGTELQVELLDAEAGETVTLDRVLLVADGEQAAVGRPLVANASVAADVVRQVRGEKLISFKYRPKARRRVTKGHRQELMVLRIRDIVFDGRSAAADAQAAETAARTERERVEEAARRQAAADAELAAKLAATAPAKPARSRSPRGTARPADDAAAPSRKAPPATTDSAKPRSRSRAARAVAPDAKPAAGGAADETADASEQSGGTREGEET